MRADLTDISRRWSDPKSLLRGCAQSLFHTLEIGTLKFGDRDMLSEWTILAPKYRKPSARSRPS